MEKEVLAIKNILNDYFGEENVDIQNCYSVGYSDRYTCLVKYDSVTVTNEYDDSHIIKGVYIRFIINNRGYLHSSEISLGRSIYSYDEFKAGYKFSHCPSFSPSNISTFSNCCLGSGPIRGTITQLMTNPTETLWMLFCRELDQYIHTESIEGGPYIRMGSINSRSAENGLPLKLSKNSYITEGFIREYNSFIKGFIDYITPNILSKFTFIRRANGYYQIKESESDIIITISREFINYVNSTDIAIKNEIIEKLDNRGYNILPNNTRIDCDTNLIFLKYLLLNKILLNYNVHNGYLISEPTCVIDRFAKLCDFKGNEISITIEGESDSIWNKNYVLNPYIISPIINSFESYINYYKSKNNSLKYGITIY